MNLASSLILVTVIILLISFEESPEVSANPKVKATERAVRLAAFLAYLKEYPHMWENVPNMAYNELVSRQLWDDDKKEPTALGNKFLAEISEVETEED